jgi:hypothetical protein
MDPKDPALRIAALEKEVALLRAEIDALRAGRAPTIRANGRCPACGGDKAIHVPRVQEEGDNGLTKPLAVASQTSFWGRQPIGPFEIYACSACGFVEWYVASFEGIEIDGKDVRDASAQRGPNKGPYR